jgi:hypothetical protein
MNQNNKRSRDDETNKTSNANKKSKGEDENERKDQEIERQRHEIEHQQQENARQREEIELQLQETEYHRQQLRHYVQCKVSDCATCQDIHCNEGQHVDVPCIYCGDLGSFYRGQSTLQETVDFLRDFPGRKPIVLDRDEANQWTKDVPQELWLGKIMPYFSLKELSLGGTIAKHFQKYWVTFKSKRQWCVPKDFPSLRKALRVGEILSRRGIVSSTNENLFKIMLSNGVHDEDKNAVAINYPVSIIGESRDGCTVNHGLRIKGKEEDNVYVKNLTIDSNDNGNIGISGSRCASIHLDNVSVENSGWHGIRLYCSKRNTMKNCNVSHSKGSGLIVGSVGLMTISGNDTTIHHNWSDYSNFRNFNYGLEIQDSCSSIHLVSPLTKEKICTGHWNGQNCGGFGTVKSVDTNGKVLEVVWERPDDPEPEPGEQDY